MCCTDQLNPQPSIRPEDRILWSWLSRRWARWREVQVFVQPETVIAWQRKRFRDHERTPSQAYRCPISRLLPFRRSRPLPGASVRRARGPELHDDQPLRYSAPRCGLRPCRKSSSRPAIRQPSPNPTAMMPRKIVTPVIPMNVAAISYSIGFGSAWALDLRQRSQKKPQRAIPGLEHYYVYAGCERCRRLDSANRNPRRLGYPSTARTREHSAA